MLREKTGTLYDAEFDDQLNRAAWPCLKAKLAAIFRTRTRDEWHALMEGSDVCFAPVLTLEEARRHPHNVARGTYIELDGVLQPAPSPRFSGTPNGPPRASVPA